jgi:hypothetical protein
LKCLSTPNVILIAVFIIGKESQGRSPFGCACLSCGYFLPVFLKAT